MFLYQRPKPVEVLPAETATTLKSDGIEPELGLPVVAFDVDMRRFAPVARVEEKSVRATSEYSWHGAMLPRT
jgi:hypothetical protein